MKSANEIRETGLARPSASGLDGVLAAETSLSEVDGEGGHLRVAGFDIEALAGQASFEEICCLLWSTAGRVASGARPSDEELKTCRAALGEHRVRAFGLLPSLGDALRAEDGMDALRASLSHLNSLRDAHPEAVTAALAVFACAWARLRNGQEPLAPDPSLAHAADVLRMIRAEAFSPALADALNTYLVTVADHGMNASTFAARVVTSTGSDMISAVVAAVGALKGPLHGGAPGPVLDMLDAVGSPERAQDWIEAELLSGRRIMGMGHRIYRVRDPRASVLEKAILKLSESGIETGRLALARAVERAALGVLKARYPDRPLRANVEFYTAVLLDSLGLPRFMFSPMFAIGRVSGWCAHIQEQRAVGRLIRPASKYIPPAQP